MADEQIVIIREKVRPICKRRDVEFAGVFGSFARGEEQDGSDIDVLVRFKTPKSLLDIIGLEQELEGALGRDVDVVTERALCPHIRGQVIGDLQPLYEE